LVEGDGRVIEEGMRGIWPAIETAEMFGSVSLAEGIGIDVACE
jgi:hypothetical protein